MVMYLLVCATTPSTGSSWLPSPRQARHLSFRRRSLGGHRSPDQASLMDCRSRECTSRHFTPLRFYIYCSQPGTGSLQLRDPTHGLHQRHISVSWGCEWSTAFLMHLTSREILTEQNMCLNGGKLAHVPPAKSYTVEPVVKATRFGEQSVARNHFSC